MTVGRGKGVGVRLRRHLQKIGRGASHRLVAGPGGRETGENPFGQPLVCSCAVCLHFLLRGQHTTQRTKLLRKELPTLQPSSGPGPGPGQGVGCCRVE